MSITFTETITLARIDCGGCGGTYAINERYRADRERDGGGWHCPYCQCASGYYKNYENARLKKELLETQNALRASKCDTLREQQQRAVVEKSFMRLKRGVCPCCKRSFQNLGRHMATKHPGQIPKRAESQLP